MINGFLLMHQLGLPLSQSIKFIILVLFLVRLSITQDFAIALLLIALFQIGPVMGLIKNGDLGVFYQDMVFAAKWINVPLSYLFFKNLLKSREFPLLFPLLRKVVSRNFGFLCFNMFLGGLGLGMAFYFHGYANAVGTKGFIYAGNELTILVLALFFIIGAYYFQKKQYSLFIAYFLVFVIISFLITSKTVLLGVLIVLLIPLIASRLKFVDRTWIDRISALIVFGAPILLATLYFGITRSGIIDKISFSMKRNNYDLLTVVLSNRNRFVKEGWEVFTTEYSWIGWFMGYGQQNHLLLSGHSAEVDFFSLLFASGILGLCVLFLVLLYWLLNARNLSAKPAYVYARQVWIFLIFLIVVSNLSGHIFSSGIAGIFIGLSIAMMHYKSVES
jgi:hypothetical protein